jgi:hypothetical protein
MGEADRPMACRPIAGPGPGHRFSQLDLNLVRSYFRRSRRISGTGVPVPAEVDEGFKYKRNVQLGNFKLWR